MFEITYESVLLSLGFFCVCCFVFRFVCSAVRAVFFVYLHNSWVVQVVWCLCVLHLLSFYWGLPRPKSSKTGARNLHCSSCFLLSATKLTYTRVVSKRFLCSSSFRSFSLFLSCLKFSPRCNPFCLMFLLFVPFEGEREKERKKVLKLTSSFTIVCPLLMFLFLRKNCFWLQKFS